MCFFSNDGSYAHDYDYDHDCGYDYCCRDDDAPFDARCNAAEDAGTEEKRKLAGTDSYSAESTVDSDECFGNFQELSSDPRDSPLRPH